MSHEKAATDGRDGRSAAQFVVGSVAHVSQPQAYAGRKISRKCTTSTDM